MGDVKEIYEMKGAGCGIREIARELGDDFCFMGRQRRLRVGNQWYPVDLLFFHRTLRCLVVIDLKFGSFTHADAGQMHFYLNYARQHWVWEGGFHKN